MRRRSRSTAFRCSSRSARRRTTSASKGSASSPGRRPAPGASTNGASASRSNSRLRRRGTGWAPRFHADILIFIAHNDDDTGILAVGELYVDNNPDPLAWVAIEYEVERGKFGILVGLDLTLAKMFPGLGLPPWMNATVTGTIYFGNLPWTFEIGKLADQRTWMIRHVIYGFPIHLDFVLAFGAQIVD